MLLLRGVQRPQVADPGKGETFTAQTAPSFGTGGAANSGFIRIYMSDRSERTRTQSEIAAAMSEASRRLAGSRPSLCRCRRCHRRRGDPPRRSRGVAPNVGLAVLGSV